MTPEQQQLERLHTYLATQERDRRAEYAQMPGDIPAGNLAAVLELQQAMQQDDFAYQLDVLRSKALYLSVVLEYIDKRILDPSLQETEPVTRNGKGDTGMNKHTFDADDKSFSIVLDGENITITTTRQLTVYDIEALEAELEEVSLWAMADDSIELAARRLNGPSKGEDT